MKKDDYVAWLTQRIKHNRDRLELVEKAFAEELAKPILRRQRTFMVFLDKERSVYRFASLELQAALARVDYEQD